MPIDYNKYPDNWLTEIRPRILNRACDKCENCGLENHSNVYSIKLNVKENGKYKKRTIWFRSIEDAEREKIDGIVKTVKVILTIAHLDHDEENENISDDRLKALCQLCHLRYDAFEKYRRSFLF
jgi:hypothetical protein